MRSSQGKTNSFQRLLFLTSKTFPPPRENECDEVIAETFVEDEHRLQAAKPLCAALVYSHSLILNQICLAQGGCAFTLAGLASMGA